MKKYIVIDIFESFFLSLANADRGRGSIAPCIYNVCIKWRGVSLILQPFYGQYKSLS